MQASTRVLALLMVVLLALAGCSSESADDGNDDEDETPAATETAASDETEEEETATEEEADSTTTPEDEAESEETPEAEGTPDADEVASERGINPAELMLVSGDSEQNGQVGPYFWTNEELELAAEVQGGYYERQDEPLEVAQGDELSIETPADDFPNEITLEVFPPTEPNENGLVQMESEPESTAELDVEDPVWEVDLEPGEHYLQIATVWPTNEVWDRDREVTYRFWVNVSE